MLHCSEDCTFVILTEQSSASVDAKPMFLQAFAARLRGVAGGKIVLRSGLGYTGEEPRTQMLQNSQFVDAKVEIFLKQGSRVWAKLAEFPIERQLLTQ